MQCRLWRAGPAASQKGAGNDLRGCGHRQDGPRHRGGRRARSGGVPADAVQEHRGRVREGRRVARGPRGVAVRRRRGHGGHRPLLDGALLVPRRPGLLGRRDKPHVGQGGAQAQGARQGQERPRRRRAHSRGAAHRPVRRDQARHRRGGVAEVTVALPAVAARHGRGAQAPPRGRHGRGEEAVLHRFRGDARPGPVRL